MTIAVHTHGRNRSIHIGLMLEGRVTPAERTYATDRLRRLIDTTARPVVRARAHLYGAPHEACAVVDCVIFLADDTLVIAGAVGVDVPTAVNLLIARLSPRLTPNRDHVGPG